MSFAKLYRIFYLISLILITLGFMEYSAKSFSWGGNWFSENILFMFDPFLILRFFDTLLIPVFPLILVGIWLGHKRLTNPNFFRVYPLVVNFLSCFTPIIFMFSCAYSSFYILLFLQSDLKSLFITKLNEIVDLVKSGQTLDTAILSIADLRVRVGTTDISIFSDSQARWFVDWVAHNVHKRCAGNDLFESFIYSSSDYFIKSVESELLDTSSPYSIYLPDLSVEWKFLFDDLTVSMFLVVSTITFLVILFAWVYIAQDERRPVFFFLLTVFAGFMIVLVAAHNYLILFIGWEGVGLSSFLLINFWYTRLQANKAAAKAVIVNRVGDIFLIAALSLIYYNTNTFDFGAVADRIIIIDSPFLFELVCLFLFFAAVGKSAQLGLHTWLPDAIEGPTPVSALLHAATMVTAGIYLLIRSSVLLSYCTIVPLLIAILGLFTAFFAATAAIVQYDIKKVVAYSTCSQLGYIIMGVGLKQFNIAFFHLFNHAFFKALLFIAAGSVIHNLINEQDIRKIGGLANTSFYLFLSNSIGVAALAGSMFLSGFYSKDLILESSISTFTISGLFIYWLATLTAIFTGIYSSDSLDDSFLEETNVRRKVIEGIHPTSLVETFVLFVLVLFSLFSGYVFKDMFVGLGSPFLSLNYSVSGELFVNSSFTGVSKVGSHIVVSSEFLPTTIKLIPIVASFVMGFQCYRYESTVYRIYSTVSFMSYKWYFDALQNKYFAYNFFRAGYSIFWLWDKYIFEQFRFARFRHTK